jgi:acyl CoA:acetate/3-ketoacid CoA transferase alpha subunit
MGKRSKVVDSFDDAVAGIEDGSTIAFGGFALPGSPFNLTAALLRQGAKRLVCVGNTTAGRASRATPISGCWWRTGRWRR